MKKFRRLMFILIILFAIMVFFATAALAFSDKSFMESAFSFVTLVVSSSSIVLALISQIHAENSRRNDERIQRYVSLIEHNLEDDFEIDRDTRYKLDKLLAQNEVIYEKLGGDVEELRHHSTTVARAQAAERKKELEAKRAAAAKTTAKTPAKTEAKKK